MKQNRQRRVRCLLRKPESLLKGGKSMDLKRNVAWVRRDQPIIRADGVFGRTATMNPCAVVRGDTIFLFFASDIEEGRRTIQLATAPVSDPESFSYQGTVIRNSEEYGSFDYAWCVLPHVVQLPDGTYLMIYSGNRGYGKGLSAFPGLGAAWSKDLFHWEKYENNPVLTPDGNPDWPLIGIAGGGLHCEDLGGGAYKLHLFYTGAPTLGDNVFLDQQKVNCYATSADGIHWEQHGIVRTRTTSRDYENIASTGGSVLRDEDGLWRQWYSAIGTRWNVYSICYTESEDGFHWTRGERFGDNLALAPDVRDVDKLHFLPRNKRWQDQSVSYPCVIRVGEGYRMYYCGNDYGEGGIGTAVSAPFRIALTGESRGGAKLWRLGDDTLYRLKLLACVSTAQTGALEPGEHLEGITHNASAFFEEFPEKNGEKLFSLRAIAVHQEDGVQFDLFAENRSDVSYDDVCVAVETGGAPVRLTASDAEVTQEGGRFLIRLGALPGKATILKHARITL